MKGFNWAAAIFGGLLAGMTISLLLAFMSASSTVAFIASWLIAGVIIGRAHNSWSTAWAIMGISMFLMPVISFFGIMGSTVTAESTDAELAGAAVGSFIGSGVLAFFAFFLGIAFLAIAAFTRRRA
jgi:hypothetical protein